jgi:predicted TIM-barrel fold metal-dependent hydrolase
MIVDCHTQIWNSTAQLGRSAPPPPAVCADEARHLKAAAPVDKAIVMAFKSAYLEAEIPNRLVAEYVRRNPAKMIGFAGVDPTDRDWMGDLRTAQDELRLKGVTISPEMQNFHPLDTRALELYAECARRGMPIVFEQNHRHPAAKLEFAQPTLLDEVAQEFPNLRIVITRMGHPWVAQTVVLLAKHPNICANVAGLLPQPWLSYSALLAAFEYDVMDKLLFGSDFPYRSPAACIEAMYSINQFGQGSNLPSIPREKLRGIVERDALDLLGITTTSAPNTSARQPIFDDE